MSESENKSFLRTLLMPLALFFAGLKHFSRWIIFFTLIGLVLFFLYDRYANSTYLEDSTSDFQVGSFARHKKYNSPLKRGRTVDLKDELTKHYGNHVEKGKATAPVVKNRVPSESALQKPKAKPFPEVKVKVEPVVDLKPLGADFAPLSKGSIQDEVRSRLQ